MTDELPEREWRDFVRGELAKGDERFAALERRAGKLEDAVAKNTSLTQRAVDISASTDRKVDSMRDEVQPVTDAMKTMEAGIRTIGRVGDAGAKLGKALLVGGLLWGAVKLALSGASWSEISAAIWRALGK